MPDGGSVTIGAEDAGNGMVAVTVSDTGTGMSEEVASRLFDAFFTTKAGSEQSDTGLGLTSVRFIVERAGGRISLDASEGRGSTFRVLLPVVAAQAARAV